jgi:RNA 3'-terminal phosphate cyclase (ATP)
VASLPFAVAQRELLTVQARLGWAASACHGRTIADSAGPGNVVEIELGFAEISELFTGFGERGVSAETVAARVADEAAEYLASGAPVGRHLADQLLLPLALAGGGAFVTQSPTAHFETQCAIVPRFVPCRVARTALAHGNWRVDVLPP